MAMLKTTFVSRDAKGLLRMDCWRGVECVQETLPGKW
jgi:hypothetical protein